MTYMTDGERVRPELVAPETARRRARCALQLLHALNADLALLKGKRVGFEWVAERIDRVRIEVHEALVQLEAGNL